MPDELNTVKVTVKPTQVLPGTNAYAFEIVESFFIKV